MIIFCSFFGEKIFFHSDRNSYKEKDFRRRKNYFFTFQFSLYAQRGFPFQTNEGIFERKDVGFLFSKKEASFSH